MNSDAANTSGSAGRLRRSSRAPKKLTAEFSVGDVVEVSQISVGRPTINVDIRWHMLFVMSVSNVVYRTSVNRKCIFHSPV